MTFVFRADASLETGTGHIIRCLAIAEALGVLGQEVALVGSISDVPWLTHLINHSVFESANAPSNFRRSKDDVLVIDSYTIAVNDGFITDDDWAARACLVDGSTPQYVSDVYFNLAPKQTWFPNKRNQTSPIYFGTEYIPVRSQRLSHKKEHPSDDGICKIVCVAGGSDPTRLAVSFRDALAELSNEFEAIIFTNHALIPERRMRFRPIGPDFQIALDKADLVLTAAGSTVWELVERRTPFGMACAADNQRENYAFLSGCGLAVPLGEYSAENGWHLDAKAINKLITDQTFRLALRTRLANFDFGGGALNIAKKLIALHSN